jgi:ABC-type dipeptide/oligopeptide/nickel transport system permease component
MITIKIFIIGLILSFIIGLCVGIIIMMKSYESFTNHFKNQK